MNLCHLMSCATMKVLMVTFVLLVVGSGHVQAQTTCTTTSANPCQCSNKDITIDISRYFQYPFTGIPDNENPGTYTYSFNPCGDMICGTNTNARVCQVTAGQGSGGEYVVARTISSSWTIKQLQPVLIFEVYFTGGDIALPSEAPRRGKFTFSYSSSSSSFVMKDETSTPDYLTYNFEVFGSQVAPAGGGGGGGGGSGKKGSKDINSGPIGWTLIALFFTAVILYFVVGALVNYFHRGARGTEIIPQWTFWKDFPFLLKDGFVFTFGPCYKLARDKIAGYRSL